MRTLRAAVACIFLFAPTATGTPDINSNCPLPRWDHATMDTLARREGYKINDTDIAAVPWVRRTSAAPECITVSLVEQHSSAPCTPEISFGCNAKGNVWTKMCRGRFRCQNNESFLCGYPPGRTSYECSLVCHRPQFTPQEAERFIGAGEPSWHHPGRFLCHKRPSSRFEAGAQRYKRSSSRVELAAHL